MIIYSRNIEPVGEAKTGDLWDADMNMHTMPVYFIREATRQEYIDHVLSIPRPVDYNDLDGCYFYEVSID